MVKEAIKVTTLYLKNVRIAHYQIDGDILYLKVINEGYGNEDFITSVISEIEKVDFSATAYLNI